MRILVLGDSFTAGANVPTHTIYTHVLERLFNENSVPTEVINTGVGGWQPFHYAQYYEHYGKQFSPDTILIGFFVGNDTYDPMDSIEQSQTAILGRRVSRQAAASRAIRFKILLYENSQIARFVMNIKRPVMVDFSRKNCQNFSNQYLNIQQGRLNNHLKRTEQLYNIAQHSVAQIRRIKAIADTDNVPLVVVLIPDENQVNQYLRDALLTEEEQMKYDFGMPQSMLKEIFAKNNIPVIDLLPAFLEDTRCCYMNDTHWSVEGHELAAAVIYEKLTRDNLLPHPTARWQSPLPQ